MVTVEISVGLQAAFKQIDALCEQAIKGAHEIFGPDSAADPFRGLHLEEADINRLLLREPITPNLYTGLSATRALLNVPEAALRVSRFAEAFDLSLFDLDVMLIALASELDTRYERLFAYLQDDISRKLPTVDLALNLLCGTLSEKLARQSQFFVGSPLRVWVDLVPDPNQSQPPTLAHYLKPDEQLVRYFLGVETLDSRLAATCRCQKVTTGLDALFLDDNVKQALRTLCLQNSDQPLRLYLHGPDHHNTAQAVAGELGLNLLTADMGLMQPTASTLEHTIGLLGREAWLQDALLYIDNVDVLAEQSLCDRAASLLCCSKVPIIFAGAHPRTMGRFISVPYSELDFSRRLDCWATQLSAANISLAPDEIQTLSARFRLSAEQIHDVVTTANSQAQWQAAQASTDLRPTSSDVFAAARMQTGQALATLARRIVPMYTWDDIVLPPDVTTQLVELCQRVAYGQQVFSDWGFKCKLSLGRGINALFAGPTGTGKTMAAEIIANELQLDLYKIDLSGVVSKYIGETEKNLDRIFSAAENSNAILLFDEADALFGKRSEVHDSHDRYANLEISYLLQKMEHYQGVAILTTNLRDHLDEAFTRRLAFIMYFPFPDEISRERIWQGVWPSETPLADDIDFAFMARQFKLSGGSIKNVCLNAAFLAAAEQQTVHMAHLLRAVQREYNKMGKVLTVEELDLAVHAQSR